MPAVILFHRTRRAGRSDEARPASLPAKLTRPDADSMIDRSRLLRLIDSCEDKPITWLVGPPGVGKTAVVSRYLQVGKHAHMWFRLDSGDADPAAFFHYPSLAGQHASPAGYPPMPMSTPDRLANIAVFTQGYFEQLCERFQSPVVLVLDNYQDAGGEVLLHEIAASAASSLQPTVRLIVASRDRRTNALARLHVNGALAIVSAEALELTREETGALAIRRGRGNLEGRTLDDLHRQTHGWAAGIVLLEQVRLNKSNAARFDEPAGEAVFDYFAGEVLQRALTSYRMILHKTALLPQINAREAQALAVDTRAPRLLATLVKNSYLTYRLAGSEPSYQHHPLFREFLQNRLVLVLYADELAALRRQVATLAETAGQVDEAAALWRDAGQWAVMSELILRNASALINQRRHQTLRAGRGRRAGPGRCVEGQLTSTQPDTTQGEIMKPLFFIGVATASLTWALPLPVSAAGEGEWWEMTTMVEMPGMPAIPGGQAVKFCRVKDDEARPVQSKDDKDCAVSNVKNLGNIMTFNVICTGKDAMTGSGELTSTATTFNQRIKMRSGGEDMAMVASGKRIGGACKAGA